MIFADGHAVSNAPDVFGSRKLTGTGAPIVFTVVGAAREVLKVLSALNGAVCFVTPLRWFVAAWTAWRFFIVGKAPFTVHYNKAECIVHA